MPISKKLTAKTIQSVSLSKGEKSKKLFDGDGLFLFISPTGRKYWRLAYRRFGKPQTLSIGEYPRVSLAQAREYAALAKIKIAHGEKPQSQSFSRHTKPIKTFKIISLEYLNKKNIQENTRKNSQQLLVNHLFDEIGLADISKIDRKTLISALKKSCPDSTGTIRRVVNLVSQVFDFAIAQNLIETNPAALINISLTFGEKKPTQHYAALNEKDLPVFFENLNKQYPCEKLNAYVLCLKFLILTWARFNEIQKMEWQDIDEKNNIWLIPAEKMKAKREHLVPLSKQALVIIHAMKPMSANRPFVFSPTKGKLIAATSLKKIIRACGFAEKCTLHGWRSTASTWANLRSYNADAIEAALAHKTSGVRGVYNRAQYIEERRKILQDYADFLAGLGLKL